jgi:hypothetical protein
MQLIEILSESDDPDAGDWIAALHELVLSPSPPPRYDLFVYVCGKKPRRIDQWLPTTRPHKAYSGRGPLHAVEVHLVPFDEALLAAYPGHVISRG